MAIFALRPTDRSSPYDLGSVISNPYGLTGHLVLIWSQKFEYQLVVEPNDPVRRDGFSVATTSAPRPLSVDIQLKDSHGSVLCGKTILLKFDPRRAAAMAASGNGTPAATGANASAYQAAQALEIAQAEAQELTREQGQDVFQNNLGRDGQTDSISAQGDMPCSREVFGRSDSWNFSPNFLTIDQQAELQNHLSGINSDANIPPVVAIAHDAAPAPRRTAKKKATVAPEPFFAIEGDDELVMFDFSKGTLETSTRKLFVMDKLSVGSNLETWQEVPANIHYRCDLNSVCIIRRKGAGVLYARLRK